MSDAITAALISGGAGIVVGLVPFAYRVRKDRREETARRTVAVDDKRKELRAVASAYLACLGKVMALLDVLRVDAANADELLQRASDANAELQGFAQGELFMTFSTDSPPVRWADAACRRILRKAVDIAINGRAEHASAVGVQNEIRALTEGHIDEGGPRELLRWALDSAVTRWPEPLLNFEEKAFLADVVSGLAEMEPFEPNVT
jgi:hypothetical protein